MSGPVGKRILVTGASGLVGFPLAIALAEAGNEVFAAARFTDPSQSAPLEAAGVRCLRFDLASQDLSSLPPRVDLVYHLGALTDARLPQSTLLEVNAQATGRIVSRYREVEAFVHAGSGSSYAHNGGVPMTEDGPLGLHGPGLENYSLSKIVAEGVLRHAAAEWQVPTVILRCFTMYGPRGGAVAARIAQMRRGLPIQLYPGQANRYSLLYEDDFVELFQRAAALASTPALIVNLAGSEPVDVVDYCRFAGQLLGIEPSFEESAKAYYPLLADTSKMEALLGKTRVRPLDGIRRVVEGDPALMLAQWRSFLD